ncbi:phage tail assembly chaperone G, partial [Staphylococcus haemolyticus]|uniref:phage tail assembly chaperone G n=1 Tax=Staphylococcus haemolyticus TaxID=1283 RepID=UPI0034D2FA4B
KLADVETDEEAEKLYQELDELEATDEYKEFLNKSEELNEQIKEESDDDDFEVYDEFANLLVKVFDNQFTIDEVFDGLEVENSLQDTYSKIFASNDAGKSKKKATTTKTKQQTK